MKRIILAALLLASLALSVRAQVLEPERQIAPPTLTVHGNGEVYAAPDTAVVRLGATIDAPQADEAQRQVNAIMQRALEGIRALGVRAEDIQTAGLSLAPVYEQRDPRSAGRPTRPHLVGYRASNTLRIQLTDLERVGAVIDAGVAAGANQIEGIDFSLRDDQEARRRALREAVAEARGKAETIAEAMRLGLESVYEVQEGGVNIISPRMEMRAMAFDAASTPVQPGQVQLQASVTVRYRIQAK